LNQRRVVGILQELATATAHVSSLQAELAEAMAEQPVKRTRARKLAEPSAEPSAVAIKSMRHVLRQQGVRT